MPHTFKSLEDLHASISSPLVQETLARFASKRAHSVRDLVNASVAGNTFRAFHFRARGLMLKPSDVFRSWTTEYLERECQSLVSLPAHEAMVDRVCLMASALDEQWHASTGGLDSVRIGFGRSAKLLGLALKHLLWHPSLSEGERANLIPLLNVPLDSYTLQGIRLIAPELGIPSNATMKFVRDEAHYRVLQARIKDLMPAGFHPIHYETAAWNLAHPRIE